MSGAGISSILATLLLSSALVGILLMMLVLKDKPARVALTVTHILYYVAFLALLSLLALSGYGNGYICGGEPFYDCRNMIIPISFLLLVYIVVTCWCTPVPGENSKPDRAPLEEQSTKSVPAFHHQDQNTIPAAMGAVAPAAPEDLEATEDETDHPVQEMDDNTETVREIPIV